MKSCLKRAVCAVVAVASIATSVGNISAAGYDYSEVLKNAIGFYDANKCGPDVAENNVFEWRSACHTEDGSDVGADLTGGYHDAGDHVKFGLPQAYSASVLGWSLYEFDNVFEATGNKTKMLEQLKYFTDYFLRSHTDSETFYYQIGDGEADHNYWGPPELQTGIRPTKCVADASNPASDILGETSAALAIMYLNYKDIDSTYADRCLKAAKELYVMGTSNRGLGDGQYFYRSTSIYDDLAWAATWLNTATGDDSYIEDAKKFILERNESNNDPLKHRWTMCWDDMYIPALVKLAEITGDETYKQGVQYNLDYWINSIETTPGGLRFLHYWGCLRYAAAESMVAVIFYKQNPDKSYLEFAKSQIDYILGDNPENMSYVVGMGSNWSVHPHHRAAQGGMGYDDGANNTPAKYLLLGALIGGPDNNDNFEDSVIEYQYTEVALDYNAGFVGALAGVAQHYESISTPIKTPVVKQTPTAVVQTPTPSKFVVGDVNMDGGFDALDFAAMRSKLLGRTPAKFDSLAADVNGDGESNALDFAFMRQKLLGMISKFKAE